MTNPFVFAYSATDRVRTTFVYDRATDTWSWHIDNEDVRADDRLPASS
jgi:hypothetical protein